MSRDIGKLLPAQGVLTDPLLTVSELLLNPKLCGPNNENLRLDYEQEEADDGEDIKIGNFITSLFAKYSEAEVKRKWGQDVKPLFLLFKYVLPTYSAIIPSTKKIIVLKNVITKNKLVQPLTALFIK